jgi:hypothetical protein
MPHVHLTSWQAALLVVSVGLAGGWFLMLWLVSTASRQRHVRAQPETGDLGPESPAVAGMLCHGGRVGDEVAAATLLDLAARHVVDLEEVDPQLSLCRIRQPGGAGLAPYERRILSYLDALAAGGVVPAQALAEGVTRPAAWWRKLRGEVVADARARGLSRPRWTPFLVTVLGLPAALPAAGLLIWLVSVTGASPTLGSRGIVGGTIVAAVGGVALVRRLNTDRLTAAGAAAADHWLGVRAHLAADQAIAGEPSAAVTTYGRSLAYAAALGLARTAIKSLPIGAPANPRIGWSTYGTGQWHKVDISYSRRLSWGTDPRQMLTSRLLGAAPAAGVAWLFFAVIPGLPAIGWVALAIVALALAGAARAVADMAGASQVEGEVVRVRPVVRGRSQQGRSQGDAYWIAVDDGTGSTVRAWRVGASIYRQVNEGDVIRVRVTRIFRHVSGLQLISHRPQVDVEASLPAWQRKEDGAARRRAVLAGAPALPDGLTPGLSLATLVTAEDAAGLLGVPVSAAQALNPLEQIPGAAGNPLTRNAVLVACRWAGAAGGRGSVDVFAGSGLGARTLLGQLVAMAHKTGRPEHGGRLGQGAMLAGNVLVIIRHGVSAAVLLNDPVLDHTVPPAASPVLGRFAPILASRLAAGAGQADHAAAPGPAIR